MNIEAKVQYIGNGGSRSKVCLVFISQEDDLFCVIENKLSNRKTSLIILCVLMFRIHLEIRYLRLEASESS